MTAATISLTDFLLARFAEDEAVARAASPGPWHAEGEEVLAVDDITVCDSFALSGPQTRATADHIARHDPARVLAECEAKRRIVERCEPIASGHFPASALARGVLSEMGAAYADHPDYREEWRP